MAELLRASVWFKSRRGNSLLTLQKLQSLHLTCGYPRARLKMKKGLSTQAKWASSSSDGSSLGHCSHFSQTSCHTRGVLQTQQRPASRQWRKSQALQEDDTLEPHFPESGGWQAFKLVSSENTLLKDMLSKNKQKNPMAKLG